MPLDDPLRAMHKPRPEIFLESVSTAIHKRKPQATCQRTAVTQL